jgi:hypothetical protein
LALDRSNDVRDGRLVYRIVVHETATGHRVLILPTTTSVGPIAFTRDSRGLVVTDSEAITQWDLATQKPEVRYRSPGRFTGSYGGSFASSLVMMPNGSRAVTGQADTTALVWNLPSPTRRVAKLGEREVAAAWADLAGADAAKAYDAACALADAGGDVVSFLRYRLRPVEAPADGRVQKLISQLGVEEFSDREAAERELRDLGDAATPALRAALKVELSAEQARRVGSILTAAEAPVLAPGDRLRAVRAVAVLEWLATKNARDLLDRLAGGLEGARLTREAKAAAERPRPR